MFRQSELGRYLMRMSVRRSSAFAASTEFTASTEFAASAEFFAASAGATAAELGASAEGRAFAWKRWDPEGPSATTVSWEFVTSPCPSARYSPVYARRRGQHTSSPQSFFAVPPFISDLDLPIAGSPVSPHRGISLLISFHPGLVFSSGLEFSSTQSSFHPALVECTAHGMMLELSLSDLFGNLLEYDRLPSGASLPRDLRQTLHIPAIRGSLVRLASSS